MRIVSIAVTFLFLSLTLWAEDSIIPSSKQKYLSLTSGLVSASYRDFATSPLFYEGMGIYLGMNRQRIKEAYDLNWGLNMMFSATTAKAPQSEYYPNSTLGFFSSFNHNITYLRSIPKYNSEKMTLKAGGTFLATQNIRVNPFLDNSAAGLESLAHLMISAKATRDISRVEEKTTSVWILNLKQNPVKREISFQIDLGVLNFNHRPSYNYVYDSSIDGTNTSIIAYVFDSYTWKLNGWRIGTKLEFTRFASTGNGKKVAYVWDILSAPGNYAIYQMATHRLEYSLLINTNK